MSRDRHSDGSPGGLAARRAFVSAVLALVILTLAGLLSRPALAQGGGGAGSTESISVACNGNPRALKLCKPGGRFCDGNATILAAPPSGIAHAGGHEITFTGVPSGGAIITYAMSASRLGDIDGTAQRNPATGVFTNPDQAFSVATGASETYQFTIPGGGSYTQQVVIDRQPPGTASYNYVAYTATCAPRPSGGRVTIVKSSLGGAGTFPVTLTRSGTVTTVNVTTSGTPDGTGTEVRDLAAGSYAVSEQAPAGWTLNDVSCVKTQGTGSASRASLNLASGDAVTCTITNTKDVAGLNLRMTARTASFRAVGGNIVFDLVVSNTGASVLTGVSVAAPGTAVSGCSAANLAPGATIRCTSTRTVTQADLDAGLFRNSATATATDPGIGAVSARAVSTVPAVTGGGIALDASASPSTYSDVGDRVTFAFEVTNRSAKELTSVTLEGTEIALSRCRPIALPGTLPPGARTRCERSVAITTADLSSTCLVAAATAKGLRGADPVEARASAKSCLTPDKTNAALARFVARRVDRLAAHEPDAPRRFWRLDRSRSEGGDTAVAVTGSGDDAAMSGRVATSLDRMRRAGRNLADADAEGGETRMGLGALEREKKPAAPVAFDIWSEAHFERWSSEDDSGTRNGGDFGVAFLGADYVLSPSVLIGALIQADWMSDHAESEETDITGTGWLAGPYVAAKLSENLVFDARTAWGTSDNRITPFGTYTDSFETSRWLARANLTGDWRVGDFRLSPHAGLVWVEETQESYTDSIGLAIDAHTTRVGRLVFGPEIGYAIRAADGTVIEPYAGLEGQWDFERRGTLASDPANRDGADIRLKAEAGVSVHSREGVGVRAVATWDGIGSPDFEAIGGAVSFSVPLEVLGEDLLPALGAAPMALGAAPMVVAQAAIEEAVPATEASGPDAGEVPPATEEEPSYELPAIIVEAPAEEPVRKKARKRKPAAASQPGDAPAPSTTPKSKKPPNGSSEAGAVAQGGAPGDAEGPAEGGGETSTAAGEGTQPGRSGERPTRVVERATTVSEITASDIERRGARTLDEAIALVPGVHTRNGPDGVPRLDIRGLRTRNVLLLLDGVPLNSAFDGQFDPRSIPVGNIAKIKVSKGASSVLYGPGGNAAVIDIVTKGAAAGKHGSVQAEWSPERGHDEQATASYGGRKLKVFMSATNRDQEHFTLSEDYAPTALEDGDERTNSDRSDQALYANTVWQPVSAASFGMSVNWRTGEYGKPPGTIGQDQSLFAQRTRFERVDDYEALSIQSSSLIKLSDVFSIRPTAYYNGLYELTNNYDGLSFSSQTGANALREDARTSIGGGGLQAAWRMGQHLTTVSADAHVESWRSEGFQVPCLVNGTARCSCDLAGEAQDFAVDRTIEVISTAAEQELTLAPGFTAVLGAGLTEQIRGGIRDDDYTWLAGTRYELSETTAVRAAIARKLRHPTLRDLYDIQGGNPELKTEVTRNTELGIEQQIPALKTAVTLAYFRTEAENFIERQQGISENIAALFFEGVEAETHVTLMPGLDLTAGYTWLDAVNETPGIATRTLQYRPEHKATLSAAFRLDGGLRLTADYLYVAGSKALPSGGGDGSGGANRELGIDYELPPQHVVNLGAAQEIPGTKAEIYGRVDNLTDENTYQAFGFPEPGRTFWGGVRAKY